MNSKLVVVGDGTLIDKVKRKIQLYNLEEKVLLLGQRSDVYKIYSVFDLFLMPSFAEGFSISLVEAQANGLKCFTSENVDDESNITGNVKFLSLESSAKKWAQNIYNFDNRRDNKVLDKIPERFDYKESYKKVFDYYEKNIN